MWNVFISVFTLSHGQSHTEMGFFSINKEMVIGNLKPDSQSALRVYDHIASTKKS